MKTVSERKKVYFLNQSRLNAVRLQKTLMNSLEAVEAKAEKEREENEKAQAEKERLRKLL